MAEWGRREKPRAPQEGWNLAAFIVAAAVASLVVFFLGVFVGQRLEGQKGPASEAPLLPVQTDRLSTRATGRGEDMTFYDVLASKQGGRGEEGRQASEKAQDSAKSENPEAKRPDPDKPSGWTVQINAFQEKRSADALVQRLKEKGVDAYMMKVEVRGQTWFRVRAGQFDSREKAKQLERKLKTEEKLLKAFATRAS